MNSIIYKRYSSDRSETIEVVRSSLDDWPETFLNSLAAEGAEVFTENPDLLRVFGTAKTDLDEADAALRSIRDAGGIVVGIRLRYLSDGIKAAFSRREDPADNPDLDTAGFIAFGRDMLDGEVLPAERGELIDYLSGLPAALLEALLNDRVYEAVVTKNGRSETWGPYPSPETALEDVIRAVPECCYAEEDFEASTTYRLKSRLSEKHA